MLRNKWWFKGPKLFYFWPRITRKQLFEKRYWTKVAWNRALNKVQFLFCRLMASLNSLKGSKDFSTYLFTYQLFDISVRSRTVALDYFNLIISQSSYVIRNFRGQKANLWSHISRKRQTFWKALLNKSCFESWS